MIEYKPLECNMMSETKAHKDFSVIIPTYNRSKFVKQAITSVLRQKNVSLEIIIGDDCSTDDTREAIKRLNDKRIKYYKNRERLGSSMNMLKCFLFAKGDYIFTLGDDDFILSENTLFEVLKIMKKYKIGLGRIGSISYEKTPKYPYQLFTLTDKLAVTKPKDKQNILIKAVGAQLGYFSGIIFNNHFLNKDKLKMDHRCYLGHICQTYHRAAYDLIQKHGIVYIPDHFVVAHLSLQMIPTYYSLEKMGRSFMEDPIMPLKDIMNKEDYEQYKKKYLRRMIVVLPQIKLYTDNQNFISFINRLINIDKSLVKEPRFYFFMMVGFLPKIILRLIRRVAIYYSIINMKTTLKKYSYSQKLEELSL